MSLREGVQHIKSRRWWYAACLGLAACGLASPVKLGVVSGHSMSPTLRDAQVYLLNRAYYAHQPVRRGDVLVFRHDGGMYVKRVAATAGDTVYLVKSADQEEDLLVMDWQLAKLQRVQRSRMMGSIKLVKRRVPPGYCYVLGDNLDNSVDSREFGPVPLTAVEGHVMGTSSEESPLSHLAGNFQSPSAS